MTSNDPYMTFDPITDTVTHAQTTWHHWTQVSLKSIKACVYSIPKHRVNNVNHTHPHTPLLVRRVNRGYKICTMKSWIYPQFAGENLSVYPHLHRKSSTCVYKTMTYYYANGELNSFFKNKKKTSRGGYTSPFA